MNSAKSLRLSGGFVLSLRSIMPTLNTPLPLRTCFHRASATDCIPLATDSGQFYRFHPITLSPTVKQGMSAARADPPLLGHCEFGLRVAQSIQFACQTIAIQIFIGRGRYMWDGDFGGCRGCVHTTGLQQDDRSECDLTEDYWKNHCSNLRTIVFLQP